MKRNEILGEDAVTEIDNGPRGRVQTDKINYGQTRNMTGGTASRDELAQRRAQQRADDQRQRDAIKARDARYAEPRTPKVDLDAVWRKVEDVVGQTVPDGDPIDWLIPWFEKQGIKDFAIGEILTKAARKNGYRDMYDYYHEMVQHYNELQGESVTEDTPGYVRYEEMKDRLASILIKLYDSGKDLGEISAMADQVAAKLGYDPTDKIFQQAWRSSITDVNLDTNFGDDEPEDNYTDYSMRRGEMGESSDDYQPQSSLGKALWRDLGKKKQVSQVQVQRNKERWAKNPYNPANKKAQPADEEIGEAAGLYGPFTVTINSGERPTSRIKTKKFKNEDDAILWVEDWFEDHPQYVYATAEIADLNGNVVWISDETIASGNPVTTEVAKPKGVVDKNVGKVRKNDVVQTDLKPGDPVIGDIGRGTSVFGKVKRIGREHIFMISNSGEEMAFRPEHIELLTPTYWLDKLDAENARRQKFKKEDADLNERAFLKGDLVNHTFFPQGGTVIRREGNIIFVRDNKTHKVFRMSIMNLLQGNLTDEDIEEDSQLDEIIPVIAAGAGALAKGAMAAGKAIGGAVSTAAKTVGGALGNAAGAVADKVGDAQAGKIEKVTGTDVTIKNPDGTSTTAPAAMLTKDEQGNLVLNKSAPQPAQQKPITPGQTVSVVDDIKKLAGI